MRNYKQRGGGGGGGEREGEDRYDMGAGTCFSKLKLNQGQVHLYCTELAVTCATTGAVST